MSLNAMLQDTKLENDLIIHPTSGWDDVGPRRVMITDIRVPFGSLAAMLLKCAFAAIPAALLLGGVVAAALYVITELLGVRLPG
jgi:hypothetical protein